ncbi:gamma-2-syntrophin [Hemiscyllium ocellatum]|uniref:gamma-2-syntrophin n=1 Tax=Hemiscyllium ocellatum TaxID=170820 RepID=UPI002965E438|nr:gamma-2-syntrophin [Hemiscyllium ocellatum]
MKPNDLLKLFTFSGFSAFTLSTEPILTPHACKLRLVIYRVTSKKNLNTPSHVFARINEFQLLLYNYIILINSCKLRELKHSYKEVKKVMAEKSIVTMSIHHLGLVLVFQSPRPGRLMMLTMMYKELEIMCSSAVSQSCSLDMLLKKMHKQMSPSHMLLLLLKPPPLRTPPVPREQIWAPVIELSMGTRHKFANSTEFTTTVFFCLEQSFFNTKTGIARLFDEESENAYDIRLKLSKDVITIQKQDVVCVSGSDSDSNHRTVTLRRQPVGGMGLSIKGGAEHGVPVVISKIFKDQAADQTGMLFVGDAVLQVNGINVENATHEEVVHLLRNAGDEVTITVQYLREAPSFLKLPLGSPGPSSDHSSGASSPLFDSGLHLNGNSTNTAPSSPSSPSADEPKYEKRWLDTLSVPLSMARVSRYRAGADQLRPNTFEIVALDGVSTGILQFYTAQESADWVRAISTNINDLTLQNMKMANKCCPSNDQIIHMGWVSEKLLGAESNQLYKCKFLGLKGSSLHIFNAPPVSIRDWLWAEKIYNLCEILCKVHKLWLADECWLQANLCLGLHQDCELQDQRPYGFSVLAGQGENHYFCVEMGSDLAVWEKTFQRAIFMEVQRAGSKTYGCTWQGQSLSFTIDFAAGFTCVDSNTKNVIWRFKFSQLKGSSDDGKTCVKLLFQNTDTRQIDMKELEFPDLTAVLHCIHSFIAAKVAAVDPVFVDSLSVARKYMYSS